MIEKADIFNIYPILHNDIFVSDMIEKADIFNIYPILHNDIFVSDMIEKADIFNIYPILHNDIFVSDMVVKANIFNIYPILHNDICVSDMIEKVNIFNFLFSPKCSSFQNSSTLPNFKYRTERRFEINERTILNIINSSNVNKSHGWDKVAVKMVKTYNSTIVSLLAIIFQVTGNNLMSVQFIKK